MDGLTYPVSVQKIPVVERQNDLRINVFGYEDGQIFPVYISKKMNEECVNLLLLSNGEVQHYTLITNMSRLLCDESNHNGKTFICFRCLHRFSREDLLKDHTKYCSEHGAQKVKMPVEGSNLLYFKNQHFQHDIPYTIFADFESILVPIDGVKPDLNMAFTQKSAIHIPSGYAYVIIGPDGQCVKPMHCYRGENAVNNFLEKLLEEKNFLENILFAIKPLKLSFDEELSFQQATHCFLCKKELKEDRVRDHDHLSGRYRGALHRQCNLNFSLKKVVPVVFHNLKNYDAHHIMCEIGKIKGYELSVIATNMEKYISFSLTNKSKEKKIELKFIDSLQFMPSSIEKLVSILSEENFVVLKQTFPVNSNLLIRKGIYPYEYVTCFEKFDEKELPSKDAFYSSLKKEGMAPQSFFLTLHQTLKLKLVSVAILKI
ncbi:uncharacterized protein LOC129229797 [Uloborus diversus]|uniref:uncharacterized protein LOC129229797 n=1 Tax=Uloborus diversus TaxID=327109 RepID=UPI00240A08E8|nr:uncharacterized protein LOC129229797 [Uloborus diversus]